MRRIAGLILIVVLTIAASIADGFRTNLWQNYQDIHSPYLADLPSGAARAAPAPLTVVVLVRALRLDDARRLPVLNELRDRGSDLVVLHDVPSYRLPVWVTLFSGAPVEAHGVTTNFSARASSASSIFRELQLAGEAAAIVGSQALADLYADDVQRFELVENPDVASHDDEVIALAQDVLRDTANPLRLLVVEFTAIEQWARVDAANVDTALSVTNSRLQTLVESLDPATAALVVLSDRGLTRQGADGGAEPEVVQTALVMAGPGIASGEQGIIQAVDVAPTLAALTGAPMPVHAQGRPALQALALPAQVAAPTSAETITGTLTTLDALPPLPALLWSSATQLAAYYEGWSEVVRLPRFAAELLRAHQVAIQSGDEGAYTNLTGELRTRANAGQQSRLDVARATRLPVAIGGALFLLAILGYTISTRRLQPFLGAALYLAAWYALFTIGREYRASLSMFTNSNPAEFMLALSRDSTMLLAAVCAIIAVTTGRQDDALEAIATVMTTLLLIAGAQAAQVLWFYFQWGADYTYQLPEPGALVSVMVALTQLSALSIRITTELPNLPLPLAAAFLTLIIFTFVRQREKPAHYGRLR